MSRLVSIIITTYNRCDLIIEAVESCLQQSYPNIEVIVVDDGSTDNTHAILSPYITNNQIIYHYKENAERAAARNTGMKLSKGEFVKFLDSDDFIDKEYTKECVLAFELDKKIELVHTNCCILNDDGSTSTPSKKGVTGNVYETLWEYNNISLSAVMMKKSVFDHHGGFDETRSLSGAEDWEYWVRLSKEGCIVGFVPNFLTTIRMHAENGTMNDINKIVHSTQEAERLLKQKFEIEPFLLKKLEARLTYLQAVYSHINNERLKSIRFIANLIGSSPVMIFNKDPWLLFVKNFVPVTVIRIVKNAIR